jgi:hypothetical protein
MNGKRKVNKTDLRNFREDHDINASGLGFQDVMLADPGNNK